MLVQECHRIKIQNLIRLFTWAKSLSLHDGVGSVVY